MGTSADGDGRPDNGGPFDGLPDLPAEWGSIVIPDDPAELAAEADLVRRELRLRARSDGWRRRLGLASDGAGPSTLRLPLVIMSIAILATLTSLFAVFWPGQQRPPANPRAIPSGSPGRTLPALDMVGEDGGVVSLRGLLPAVIILIDGCTCADEVTVAVQAVPAGVTVVALTGDRAAASPATKPVPSGAAPLRSLADPAGELRKSLHLAPHPGTAAALLVARSGQILRTVPALTSVADYQAELSRLATG